MLFWLGDSLKEYILTSGTLTLKEVRKCLMDGR